MNTKVHSSVCVRCGKTRIVSKRWNETIAGSSVTYTLFVCPDPACQEIVEDEFQKRKDRLEAIRNRAIARQQENHRNRRVKKA